MKAVPALSSEYSLPEPVDTLRVRSADGTSLYTEVHGPAGAPTAVLAHGWTCSTLFWAPVARRLLAQGLRVVLYDLRGHGRSARPHRRGYSTTALADDLEAVVCAHVPEGGKMVLAGHSMGAMSILACSHRSVLKQRAAAVLLASTGSCRLIDGIEVIRVGHPRLRRVLHRLLATSPLPLGPANPVNRWLLRLATMGAGSAREQVAFCAEVITACGSRPRAAWGRVLAALDVAAGVAHLHMPTTVIAGTHDRLTPLAHSDHIVAQLPRLVEFLKLHGAGHMTPVERPEEVAGAILRLVREHLPARKEVA